MKKYLKYKGVTVNTFGFPVFNPNHSDDNKDSKKLAKRYYQYRCFEFNYKINSPRNLVVMYDIPNNKRKERNWFRRHLLKFGYLMIQKSVWVGPSPLPKDFKEYLEKIKLDKCIKTFKLAKSYVIK